ncbi:MAG: DUF4870 domain-containing protein [Anaerolineales bacterium]|nr:DUF4870 domain-containing protein [Anaerolineales bacterium]
MTEQFTDTEVTSDDKLWSALAYPLSPIIPIILLLMEDKKSRPFIRYHTYQALVIGIVLIILVGILSVPTFGCISVLWFITLYWAYKAYQGEMFEIPVVTNFVRNQGWV